MRPLALRLTVVFIIAALSSCKLEPCKDYRCVNGQALEDGKNCICLCNLGWEGEDCTIEDKCVTNQVVCYNGGYCNNSGVCVCQSGYEGDSCELFSRDKFLDNGNATLWNGNDTCGTQVYQYLVELKPGSDKRTLEVYNIRNLGATQFITVFANKLEFSQHTDVLIGNVEIRDARGTLSADSAIVRVSYQSDATSCKGGWARQ